MASIQDEAPTKEVSDDQVEKPTQETAVIEEKPATSEEAEVVVHDDEEEEEAIHNEVKEEDGEEDFAGSPIMGESEPTLTFDEEGEAEIEEGDMI
ncbi:protein rpi-1 [Ricinus communis]|uniref:Uncharacterized protein n=1 Tax=Ricinus communis TaxID=3988 RepID=B9SMN4_RICCO|nr:protein rpi-1 [Ricinus communis]EEF35097.1 conserved hypothetical protein [Ricinus communis]|eukprot:XP_002527253.1 protein rpi-1 [Ricinus communis]